jgi:hypothetical protein
VLSAFGTWCLLRISGVRPRTLPLLLLCGLVGYVFNASRVVLMGFAVIYAVTYAMGQRRPARAVGVLTSMAIILAVLFVVGTLMRNVNTWMRLSGQYDRLLGSLYEIMSYLISPVNYWSALVEHDRWGSPNDVFFSTQTWFNFFLSVPGIKIPVDFRENIGIYYVPYLNQVGLIGDWFAGFGPFFWVCAVLYGWLFARVLAYARAGDFYARLTLCFFVMSLCDSMRAFSLGANPDIGNILYLYAMRGVLFLWDRAKFIHVEGHRVRAIGSADA